ncbi:MAG: AAA family ATPase [Methanoregula sp.]
MIERLQIKNFKSIKDLELDCKRVNVFIGEPNTGKSNILEALGLLSWCGHRLDKKDRVGGDSSFSVFEQDTRGNYNPNSIRGDFTAASPINWFYPAETSDLHEFIRYNHIDDLFFDADTSEPIQVSLGNKSRKSVKLTFTQGKGHITVESGEHEKRSKPLFTLDTYGNCIDEAKKSSEFAFIKFYRFKNIVTFPSRVSEYLLPPTGRNLFSIILKNKSIQDEINDLFREVPFEFVLNTTEHQFNFQKKINNIIHTFPYIIASDTLRHIAFYLVALESNTKSTLVFEEPEAHAFPYYIKWLGERIALYSDNQFFIVTHNPYLISALMEKTSIQDLNVIITYMKDSETRIVVLREDQISELMCFDPFFNARSYIPEADEQA